MKLALFTLTLLMATACASSPPPQKSNLSYGVVKKEIVKGKTNQAEVVQLLGSPNIITKNRQSQEVWTYTKQSYDSESGGYYGSLILVGGSKAFSSSASKSFDLILTFDDKDVVSDYSVVSTQF